MGSISRMITEFCLDLYNKVNRTTEGQNIVFSPMSICTSLGLILLGARNNTAAQIEKVILSKQELKSLYAATISLWRSISKFFSEIFRISSEQVWLIDNLYSALQKYLMCSEELYRAALETVDFQRATEASRLKINDWVESETQGKTKQNCSCTIFSLFQCSFKKNSNERKPVQMMYQKGTFKLGYIEELGTQVLELPYAQKLLSMIILLPGDTADGSTSGLEQTESTMTYENLMLWFSSEHMFETVVEVYLPQFKLEGTFNLNEVLKAMGMTDIFTESKADLSALSSEKSLVLSNIVHKAYVEVNEEGTTAAAATGATIVRRSLPLTEVFMADRPFLFFIRHNSTDTILFFGKFCSP
uniref:Serpin family B member 11 (gene/pseudogene) n=1 Tax=Pavo cristatus TaxID=9049 RepID=A0A8C9L717_PAVCR